MWRLATLEAVELLKWSVRSSEVMPRRELPREHSCAPELGGLAQPSKMWMVPAGSSTSAIEMALVVPVPDANPFLVPAGTSKPGENHRVVPPLLGIRFRL